ncbi:hypothetical protein EJB05_33260, partial [Eragrostis curvula]
MVHSIRVALAVVVMKLTRAPCFARRCAMSIMGIEWPWAMNGTKTKLNTLQSKSYFIEEGSDEEVHTKDHHEKLLGTCHMPEYKNLLALRLVSRLESFDSKVIFLNVEPWYGWLHRFFT